MIPPEVDGHFHWRKKFEKKQAQHRKSGMFTVSVCKSPDYPQVEIANQMGTKNATVMLSKSSWFLKENK